MALTPEQLEQSRIQAEKELEALNSGDPVGLKLKNGTKLSIEEFNDNETVQKHSDTYFGYLTEKNRLGSFFESDNYSQDIAEAMTDDWNLTVLGNRALILKDAPEEVKKAARELTYIWDEQTEAKDFAEFWKYSKDAGLDVLTDPATWLGLATGSIATRGVAQAALKAQAIKNIGRTALSATPAATAKTGAKTAIVSAGVDGALWGAGENALEQSRNIAINYKNKKEMDLKKVAEDAAIVGGAALFLGGGTVGVKKLVDKFRKVDEIKVDAHTEVQPNQQPEVEIVTENEVSNLKARENIVDEPTEEVVKLAKKSGGGKRTAEALQDLVDEEKAFKDLGVKQPSLYEKTNRELRNLAANLFFKPASILSSATLKESKSVKELQNLFRYDLGERSKVEDTDFFETFRLKSGDYITPIKLVLEPFRSKHWLKGRMGYTDQLVQEGIKAGLRGKDISNLDPNIQKATQDIRQLLDQFGKELKEAGLIQDVLPNYVPRYWNRKGIENNQSGFRNLLIKSGEAKNDTEANAIIESMLNKENAIDSNSASGSFFFSRNFDKIKEADIPDEFLTNEDLTSILVNYISHGSKQLAKVNTFSRGDRAVRNIKDFKDVWFKDIEKELNSKGKAFTKRDQDQIEELYKMTTGEGYYTGTRFLGGYPADIYATATRMALLPFAQLSSMTEVIIPFAKAGVANTAAWKGLATAAGASTKSIFDSSLQLLLNRGYTKQEAWRELEEVGLALDAAAMDVTERLSGDVLGGKVNQFVNRAFFKATLLDQWTRMVQLSSFTTGKNLIRKNLTSIARRQDSGLEDSLKIRDQRRELEELGIDINKGIEWIKRGGELDDSFYKDVKRGAARFTSEVILQPTAASGLKPKLQANPATQLLFQLASYPTAFTNTILKNAAKDVIKSPLRNTPNILAAGLAMTFTARYLNWIRSGGESEKDSNWDWSDYDANMKAIRRWGGNGVLFDMVERGSRAREAWKNNAAFITGFGGPIIGDIFRVFQPGGGAGDILTSKIPGYVAFPAIEESTGIPIKTQTSKIAKALNKKAKFKPTKGDTVYFKKGGEVNVPNAPEEPDERIDKMTGLPYNFQAGIAFRDEEDPIKRLGLARGSLAKQDSISRLLGRRSNA